LPQQSPPPDGRDGQACELRHFVFVEECSKGIVCSCHLILSRVAVLPTHEKDRSPRSARNKARIARKREGMRGKLAFSSDDPLFLQEAFEILRVHRKYAPEVFIVLRCGLWVGCLPELKLPC